MIFDEFLVHYKELGEAFGSQNFNAKRGALMFKFVADLERTWWGRIVEQMIITNNPKFAIAEAAQAERRAINSAKRAKEESEAAEALLRNASQSGHEKAMELFNMFRKGKGA